MTSPVNVRIQHLANLDDVQLVHVDRLRKFVEHSVPNDLSATQHNSSLPDRISVGDATTSGNDGASTPITPLAVPGIPANPSQADDAVDRTVPGVEGAMAMLEELWNVAPAPLADPGPPA